jgi:hypothetical protein
MQRMPTQPFGKRKYFANEHAKGSAKALPAARFFVGTAFWPNSMFAAIGFLPTGFGWRQFY